MTKYEELLSAYEEEVEVEERKMKNEGLYCDGHIWINKDLPSSKSVFTLWLFKPFRGFATIFATCKIGR